MGGAPAASKSRAQRDVENRRPQAGASRLLISLAVLAAAGPLAGQDPPPDAAWFTFDTDHFRVTYHEGLEELARHAAGVAERTHAVLREDLVRAPRGRTDLVVTDHVDFSNGFATPFASNRIIVFARPPVETPDLGFNRDWLELVVAHELVHIFHLDRAGAVGRAARTLFGRVPMLWPLFPALGTPIWNVEGLATYYESRLTGAGRSHGTYQDMVVRAAALEAQIPTLRQVSTPSPVWPGGERSYVYGTALMEWIADQYGPEAHAALLDATYSAVLPTFLFVDRIARRALGRSFTAIYGDWRAAAVDSAQAVQDRVIAEGATPSQTVVRRGPYAVSPRVSPDGRWLSYAFHDYRSDAATRILDLGTGQAETLARRNQFGSLLGPAAWMPDGSGLVVAQLEVHRRYRFHSDLWLVDRDGRERRLTRDERLAQPHVATDGRRIAAVQNHNGALRLVIHDLLTAQTRVLAHAQPGEAFDSPRWSPDGRHLAATRFANGRTDVVVVDAATGAILPVTADDALKGNPTWSPDGRWILFWSDHNGIPNLFATGAPGAPAAVVADPAQPPTPASPGGPPPPGLPVGAGRTQAAGPGTGPVRDPERLWQVTHVFTGAFDPEVSPDGRTVFFVAYHHDGWRLESTAFDSATWRPAPPLREIREDGLLPPPPPTRQTITLADARNADRPATGPVGGPSRPYRAAPTARPYFWTPTAQWLGSADAGQWSRFLGVYTMGWDVLQRHSWSATAAYDIDTGRLAGGGSWTYTRLGSPDLTLAARRLWSAAGTLPLPDGGRETVLEQQDRLSLDALFWRRQWRRTAWLVVGSDVRRDEFQTYQLTPDELADAGFRLVDLPTIASLAVRPGFSTVRQHPYSISRQDGVSLALGAGRWWNVTDGNVAYDQVSGSVAGYRGHRLWGFADHVTALRIAGLVRTGDDARTTSIGGTPGGMPDLLPGLGAAGPFLPVRGFSSGDRFGTRAWAASAEYRLPIHMRGNHRHILGLSLTSVSAAVFADAGHAWCSQAQRATDRFQTCPGSDDPFLASAGAELALNLGIIHSFPLSVRYGFAVPFSGTDARGAVFYVGVGPSF